jgi:predicted nucleotidyltransferase
LIRGQYHALVDERVLHSIQAELEGRSEIVLAYVFGSVGRGTASESSDIDVAVSLSERPQDPLRYRARLAESLTGAAGGRRVEVVVLAESPPELAGRAVREGRLLLCRDEARRVRTEVDILRREFDTAPLRKALDRAQSAAIRSGRFLG